MGSKLISATIFLWSFSPFTDAFAAVLPVPKQLNSDVKFWEKVFTTYRTNHCVIHDKRHLEAIFFVRKTSSNPLRRAKQIRTSVKRVKLGLARLAARGKPRTAFEKRLYRGTPRHLRTRKFFRTAGKNLRCQMGVDIWPSLKRSQRYIPMIRKIFRKKGIPQDIAYLPHLESGFNRRATSKVGAKGLWQLMPGTARPMGLRVNRFRDSRTNPYLSTVVAAKLLKRLYRQTKSWPLAITAYNYGENGMRRAIKKYGRNYLKIRKRHKTRIFRFAAKNYYPSFIAVRNIAKRIEKRRRT